MRIFIIIGFVFLNTLLGSGFENEFNHYSGNSPKRLKVCGERCSGTNFVKFLLLRNFPDLKKTPQEEFGHKHFLWWYGVPTDHQKLKDLKYPLNAVDYAGSQDCLFIVMVRDPYDWLRSFYLKPWHVHDSLLTGSFSYFISTEWKVNKVYYNEGFYSEIDNYNPWTGRPFTNVLELRRYKIYNYLKLGTFVDNYVLARYEDVRDDPKGFVHFIAEFCHLKKQSEFVPVDGYKGGNKPYVRKQYFRFEEQDLEFINSQIDWAIEELVGYRPNKII